MRKPIQKPKATRQILLDYLREATTHTIIYLMECERETLEYMYVRTKQKLRAANWNAKQLDKFLNRSHYNKHN